MPLAKYGWLTQTTTASPLFTPIPSTNLDEISVCTDPTSIALDDHNQVWIACRDADQVQVRNASNGNLIDTLSLGRGSRPYAVISDIAGNTIYVSQTGSGQLTKITAASRSIVGSLNLGIQPRAMAITPDGQQLLVTRFISADSGGTVWNIDLGNFSLDSSINLAVDTTTPDSGSNGRGLPNYLTSVAVNPANSQALVVGKKDNIVRGLTRDGNPLTFETSVRNAIATINLATNSEIVAERVDVDDHAQPSAVSYSPLGSHVFIAMQGNNRVIVLNPITGQEVARADVGLAPQGLLIDPDTNRIFVKNFMDRSLSVLNADAMLNSGSTDLPLLATVDVVTGEALSAQVLQGKQIFYNAADTRMGLDGYNQLCHLPSRRRPRRPYLGLHRSRRRLT